MELTLLSVNVGLPQIIGERHGEPVISSIKKLPLAERVARVGPLGIEGDAQADLSVHGGHDKAIYAYPSDHWEWWTRRKAFACFPSAFGENLTLTGATETDIRIGDRFTWGPVLLEVSQPRAPCFKFQIHSGRADAGAIMTLSGRCGWYFRVLVPGETEASKLVRTGRGEGPTVRETFQAAFDRRMTESRRRAIAEAPQLALAWKRMIR